MGGMVTISFMLPMFFWELFWLNQPKKRKWEIVGLVQMIALPIQRKTVYYCRVLAYFFVVLIFGFLIFIPKLKGVGASEIVKEIKLTVYDFIS